MNIDKIKCIIEAALLAAGSSLSKDRIVELFAEEEKVKTSDVTKALDILQNECEGRGVELVEVATGFRYQARQDYAEWIARLWEERPSRYSRALLETLSLIAYRQPTTRSDIEQVRGVGVSSSIVKTLLEREWIRVVGHRDVPGKPALYATTKQFLDYFGLKSLDELPSLAEIKDLDNLNPELKFDSDDEAQDVTESRNEKTHIEAMEDSEVDLASRDEEKSVDSDDSSEPKEVDEANSIQRLSTEESDVEDRGVDEGGASTLDSGSSEGEEESDTSLKPTELH
ncbi:SMC-Scp complex subunit ScpB [Kangiella japonica]